MGRDPAGGRIVRGASVARDGMTVGETLRHIVATLTEAGIEGATSDARRLLAAATGLTIERMVSHPETVLEASAAERIDALVARRLAREPVSRIVGERDFYGRTFVIGPEVLDPRPDTETLVDCVLDIVRAVPGGAGDGEGLRLLDIGTGSGAIAVTLLAELSGGRCTGVDVSRGAIDIAVRNARRHGVAGRLSLICADATTGVTGPFDFVVSNPPYIPSDEIETLEADVRVYDPRTALDGGAEGLALYRLFSQHFRRQLAPGGWVALEVGAGQVDAVRAIVVEAIGRERVADVVVRHDLNGVARVVAVQTRLDGR